jgi:sugar lactone lactonase YvrE
LKFNKPFLSIGLAALAASIMTGCGGGGNNTTFFAGPGTPARVVFIAEPANTTTGTAIPSFAVAIEDANGVLETTSTDSISLSISTDPTGGQAALSGTTTVQAVNGIAVFNNVNIAQTVTGNEAFALQANDVTSGNLTSDTSTSFNEAPSNVSILAGNNNASITGSVLTPATSGDANATGVAASFKAPKGIAFDSHGNEFVADQGNGQVREITSAGVVTTLVTGLTAGSSPSAVCVDSHNNVFFTDTAGGNVDELTATQIAGGGTLTPTVLVGSFAAPIGIAVDTNDNIFVADKTAEEVLEIENASGAPGTSASAVAGTLDTSGFDASHFDAPFGLAVSTGSASDGSEDIVFVGDKSNNAVREFEAGVGTISTVAGGGVGTPGTAGNEVGAAASALFSAPIGLALNSSGDLFVADSGNNSIKEISGLSGADVQVSLVTGASAGTAGFVDGTLGAAQYDGPGWVDVDANGNLGISESGNNRIRQALLTP